MIEGYTQNGLGEEAFKVFHQMVCEVYKQDVQAFAGILNTCDNPKALDMRKEIHALINTTGLEFDVCTSIPFIKLYAKCGSL